ncbi:MAG: diacylglycerol kinase [bacterium]
MNLKRFRYSFKYAWAGLLENHRREQNFRIQLLVGIFVFMLAILLDVDWLRMSIILITCAYVLSLEMINSGLERYIDKLTPQKDERIGRIKDILAGAVLLAAIFAVLIGIVVFYQPIYNLFFA